MNERVPRKKPRNGTRTFQFSDCFRAFCCERRSTWTSKGSKRICVPPLLPCLSNTRFFTGGIRRAVTATRIPASCAPSLPRYPPAPERPALRPPRRPRSRLASGNYCLLFKSGFHRPLGPCEGHQSWGRPNDTHLATSNCNIHDR
jgi:hypothetical protein